MQPIFDMFPYAKLGAVAKPAQAEDAALVSAGNFPSLMCLVDPVVYVLNNEPLSFFNRTD